MIDESTMFKLKKFETHPFVSVIMPIRNEADFIESSMAAILAQDYPPDRMEILIIDGMSDDTTRALCARIIDDNPHRSIRLLDNPGRIVPKAMNIAFPQTTGDIIVRIDGHCEIAPDYVSRCVEHLGKGDVVGVGGPIETISTSEAGEAIAVAMSSKFGVGGSAFRTVKDRSILADTIPFPAYTRQAMEYAGPYDEEMLRNQDDEYNYRLRSLGYKIRLTPDVRSVYYSRASIRKLWWQYCQYGMYKVRVMQKHPQQMRPRHFVPPLLVTILIGGLVLAPLHTALMLLWLLAIALYAGANLLASFLTARRSKLKQPQWLPVAFATLHFGYGLGFLAGLLKFRRYWGAPGELETARLRWPQPIPQPQPETEEWQPIAGEERVAVGD
jgi:glycosyltransferase involved in cell wall biosynthesis